MSILRNPLPELSKLLSIFARSCWARRRALRSIHVYCKDICKPCVNSIAAQSSRSRKLDESSATKMSWHAVRSNCVVNGQRRLSASHMLASAAVKSDGSLCASNVASMVHTVWKCSGLRPQLTETSQLGLISFQNVCDGPRNCPCERPVSISSLLASSPCRLSLIAFICWRTCLYLW